MSTWWRRRAAERAPDWQPSGWLIPFDRDTYNDMIAERTRALLERAEPDPLDIDGPPPYRGLTGRKAWLCLGIDRGWRVVPEDDDPP